MTSSFTSRAALFLELVVEEVECLLPFKQDILHLHWSFIVRLSAVASLSSSESSYVKHQNMKHKISNTVILMIK